MTKNQKRIDNTCTFPPALLAVVTGILLFAFDVSAQNPAVIKVSGGSSGEAIQLALDSVLEGGEVVLEVGIFEIKQPLILQRDGLVLRGSGPATVLTLADKANCPVVILGAALATPIRKTSRLRIADLSIDGNRENQQVELWRLAADGSLLNNNGINVWNAVDTVIERVIAFRCRSGGLVTASGTRQLTVTDFTAFDNHFDGLACYLTEESRFTRLFLHNNLGAGISLDLAFNQNIIEDAVLTGNDIGVFMRDSRNNKFAGITIRDSRQHGVFIAQATIESDAGWQLMPGTECTGNSFARLDITNSGGNAFLVNDVSCTNNLVSEARFLKNAKDDVAGIVKKLAIAP